MLLTVTFALCELPYCKLYVAAEFVRKDIEKAHRYHIDMPSETMTAKRNN